MLGALLMSRGLAYDSDEGRALCGAITAVMTGAAYRRSAEIAGHKGAFSDYRLNRDAMMEVIGMHRDAVEKIDASLVPSSLYAAAQQVWDDSLRLGAEYGFRNSQATVLAPTGTIAFMMTRDPTGVDPDIAAVKYQTQAGARCLLRRQRKKHLSDSGCCAGPRGQCPGSSPPTRSAT